MSVQKALEFIHAVRETSLLAERVRGLGADVTLDQLAEIGREEGFSFTAEELRSAHSHDWSLRWIRFGPPREKRA